LTVNDPASKQWTTVCHLTTTAMEALLQVEQELLALGDDLRPLEFRTLLWVRCSLALLYGIRVDEALDDAAQSDIRAMLDQAWLDSLPSLPNRGRD
jgi:hypothetical protein